MTSLAASLLHRIRPPPPREDALVMFPAFFETCSLYGGLLNDLFLHLAEEGAHRVLWSNEVLEELQRNLANRVGADSAARRVSAMRIAFPDAVVTGYQHRVAAMPVDPGDRHVAAAAVHAGAEVIVTANLRHFPVEPLALLHVQPRHPDDFLLDQLDLYPDLVIGGLHDLADSYEHPSMTLEQLLDRLALDVPRFAAAVRAET